MRTEFSQRLHHVVGVRGVSGGEELAQVQGRLLDQRFPTHCIQFKETQKTFQIGKGLLCTGWPPHSQRVVLEKLPIILKEHFENPQDSLLPFKNAKIKMCLDNE